MSSFLSKFRKDIAGVAWLSLAIFLGLALGSFNNSDPSFNSSGTGHVVHNLCGYVGSFLSDILLQAFGVSAWLFVISAARMSYLSFTSGVTKPSKSSALAVAVLVLNSASLLSLHLSSFHMYSGEIGLGGIVGTVMSQALVTIFNKIGAAVILWTVTVIFVIFYSQKPLKEVFNRPLETLKNIFFSISKRLTAPFIKYFSNLNNKKLNEEAHRFMPIVNVPSNKGIQEAESLIKNQDKENEAEENEQPKIQNFVLKALDSAQNAKKRTFTQKRNIKKSRASN